MLLYTTFCFEASHSLAASVGLPQLHGHSYWARVWVASSAAHPTPLPDLELEARKVQKLLDHQHLNTLMEQEPTMEALVDFIRRTWTGPELKRVSVWRESLGCGAEWSAL
ncbi:MAG: 6-pyruvoyl tetrahydropterin synthase [Pseudomonadota bacterium]|jgi:6-pyruvoyl-tetrahydropterin synthase